jgi:putative aldouronate transport system permease protein
MGRSEGSGRRLARTAGPGGTRASVLARAADAANVVVMIALCAVTLYPFLYALAYSLSDSTAALSANVTVFPVEPSLENYRVVFSSRSILGSFMVTVLRTLVGVLYALAVTGLASWAISKKDLPGNRLIAILLFIPMYVSGGLLPYYVLIYKLRLFNNFLVFILPAGFSVYHMLIMRTFFETLPVSLEESVRMDGGGDLTVLLKIVVPLSKPVIATIAIFVGVWQWNQWFDSLLFVTKPELFPMQTILQKMLKEADLADLGARAMVARVRTYSPESLKMATLIVTTLPVVLIYPFLQRYFLKGVMVGAVKA